MAGGVCAVLDYEIDDKAAYIAEMTVLVMGHSMTQTESFRKFVRQMLTSTRLPSNTLLLGMNYLARRVNKLRTLGPFKPDELKMRQLLTVAVMLASKFQDDNTFRNLSWSEVTGLPVREINKLESEWLATSNWRLFVRVEDSPDLAAWMENWREWLEKHREAQEAAAREQAREAAAKLAELKAAQARARAAKLAGLPALHTANHHPYILTSPVSGYCGSRDFEDTWYMSAGIPDSGCHWSGRPSPWAMEHMRYGDLLRL